MIGMTAPEHPVRPIKRWVGERQNVLVATSPEPPPAVGNTAESGEGGDHSRADHHRQHNLTPARTVASEIMFERRDAHAAQRSDGDCCGCHEHTWLRNAERENAVHGGQSDSPGDKSDEPEAHGELEALARVAHHVRPDADMWWKVGSRKRRVADAAAPPTP